MLEVTFNQHRQDCAGQTRREFVRAGSLGLGGLTLPWLLQARAQAAAPEKTREFVRDRAVVLLFLAGGASHIETFNPNMDAPDPYRSLTGEVATPVPGITLGGTFPLLSRQAGKLLLVRSFHHPINDHVRAISHVLTGGTDVSGMAKQGCGMGAAFARLRGANDPGTGLPTYAVLTSPHKDGQYSNELGRVVLGSRGGILGAASNPFIPGGSGPAADNLKLNLPADRLNDRRELLQKLDTLRREVDAVAPGQSYDVFQQQAVDLLTGSAAKVLDLSTEDSKRVERYDTSMYECGKKVFQPSILGKQMLLARRLVEAGAGFVTVQSAGWDMHADGNNPGIESGMKMLGPTVDRALSAFLEDLEQCGLLSRTLVIVTGDFGRTPKVNKNGGRDHWNRLCTLALAGAGLPGGAVFGQSDPTNSEPAADPVTVSNLLGTVMHTLFDIGKVRLIRGLPAELARAVEAARPIPVGT
jgi:uncharacterized protein (DUF1501 family)